MIKFFLKITIIITFFFLLIEGLPYFLVDYQYEKLISKNIVTKNKIEKNLFFTSSREISIKESMWGKHIKIKKNESCWQYLILWKEPIDIIYDKNNHAVHILSSFE